MSLAARNAARKAAGQAFDYEAAQRARAESTPPAEIVADAAGVSAPMGRRGSIAQRHQQRVLSGVVTFSAAAPAAPDDGPRAQPYQLMLLQLKGDQQTLKNIQSIERKIEAKVGMLPAYDAWVEGCLASATPVQDEVLTTAMVWRMDVGDYAGALPIARYVLQHGLELPARFDRTPACLIAEEYAEGALRDLLSGRDPDLDSLDQVAELTADFDMPDEVRAKVEKAIGLEMSRRAAIVREEADLGSGPVVRGLQDGALKRLRRALELNDRVGVKKDIERLERELKKDPAAAD